MLDQSLEAKDVTEILDARYSMLDDIGINQHHDAVTGTAKQAVANDYALRLFQGMERNKIPYGKAIKDKVEQMSGLETTEEWEQCFRTNSTYLDCPVKNIAAKATDMAIAIQNPSSVSVSRARIAVPRGNYSVSAFNAAAQRWDAVKSELACYDDTSENGTYIDSCWLDIDHATAAYDMSLLSLQRHESAGESVPTSKSDGAGIIETDNVAVEFVGASKEDSWILLNVTQKQYGKHEFLKFSLRSWDSQLNINQLEQGHQ